MQILRSGCNQEAETPLQGVPASRTLTSCHHTAYQRRQVGSTHALLLANGNCCEGATRLLRPG